MEISQNLPNQMYRIYNECKWATAMVGSLRQHYLFFYFYGSFYGILGFLKIFRLGFFLYLMKFAV